MSHAEALHPLHPAAGATEAVVGFVSDLRYAELSIGGDTAYAALHTAWRERLVTLGRNVTVTQGDSSVSGIAEAVDAGGSLLLRRDDGTQAVVRWGDVSS